MNKITQIAALGFAALFLIGCGKGYTSFEKSEFLRESYGEGVRVTKVDLNRYLVADANGQIKYVRVYYDFNNPFKNAKDIHIQEETIIQDKRSLFIEQP